jgi:Ca-activated chloride channel family protein
MTLIAPSRLWLLALVAALLASYVVLQRRRRHRAVRHPDLALVVASSPRRPGWRRHVSAGALLLAVAALVVGLARPAQSTEVAREEAVVVLAIDVSGSMTATDVAPTRMEAAIAAAREFVVDAPEAFRIGLVAFDDAGHVLATPATDRTAVLDALDRLERGPGTATGDGLLVALEQVQAAVAEEAGVVVDEGALPYGAVVLLADGANTIGTPLDDAAAAAAEAGVPVFTIAYGTDDGVAEVDGELVPVPADPEAMAAVADATDGATYTAASASELADVYDRIGTRIGTITEQQELTVGFAAVAAGLLAVALLTSMLWSSRVV